MLKGFKDFIMRGNLIELAVAFIIGGAFATVVSPLHRRADGFHRQDRRPAGLRLGDDRRRQRRDTSSTR